MLYGLLLFFLEVYTVIEQGIFLDFIVNRPGVAGANTFVIHSLTNYVG